MEEAEALSTKLGIMVDGQFKCYGSAQHIKSKFGDGYELEVKFHIPNDEEITEIMRQLNINQNMIINDSNFRNILHVMNGNHLQQEIRKDGLGDNVHKEFLKGGMKVKNFIEFVEISKNGFAFLNHLANEMDYIVLIEHYGNSFKLKLPTFERSIGILFGLFEDEYKESFRIDEYSINQTSLEQIFNNFAKQNYTMAQNARIFRRNQ